MTAAGDRRRALWRCPRCGHRFVTRNLWHSCGRYRLADHFKGKPPSLRATFRRWVAAARRCGPVTVYAQKSRIVIQSRVRFAGAVVQSRWLDATLWLKRRASHRRVHRIEDFGRLGYGVHFRLTEPKQIDRKIVALMREAYHEARRPRGAVARLVAMLFLPLALTASTLRAQDPPPECDETSAPGARIQFQLPSGYRLELERTTDTLDVEFICSATVRNPADSIVWKDSGFRTQQDEWTGKDLDGDGGPDAVIGVDTGGGNRCCWGFALIRFSPAFGVLARIDFFPFFAYDETGRVLIQQVVPFYDLGPDMASSPTIILVHQFRQGRLVNITQERCAKILGRTAAPRTILDLGPEWEEITPERLAASRQASKPDYDVEETRVAVTTIALQQLTCGQDSAAVQVVNAAWPAAEVSQEMAQLRKAAQGVIGAH
ncbi:MAG TPA: DUF5655 domain-containing protein [Gemmatimonadales bacterium]|nr:DUF5655 domain-containing protein [Gemmatimonadales bacterium]